MEPKEVYMSKPWLKYYPEGVPHGSGSPRDFRAAIIRRDGG